MPRILIHFARFGPYHQARLRSAAEALGPLGWEVIGLETAGTDATYAWDETTRASAGPQVVTGFPGRVYEAIRSAEAKRVLHPLLEEWKPDVMVIAGWSGPDALACLSWCRRNGIPAIVMSETREVDGRRVWWKERIKRWMLSRFSGALVGGKSHRDYLVKLGMSPDRIAFGYDVVDNAYFAEVATKWEKLKSGKQKAENGLAADSCPPASDSSFPLSKFQLSAFSPPYSLVVAVGLDGRQLLPGLEGYAWFTGLTLALQGVAWLMWWAFENRTEKVRRWMG